MCVPASADGLARCLQPCARVPGAYIRSTYIDERCAHPPRHQVDGTPTSAAKAGGSAGTGAGPPIFTEPLLKLEPLNTCGCHPERGSGHRAGGLLRSGSGRGWVTP